MAELYTQQLVVDDVSGSASDGDGPFCPECGQSLDLTHHEATPGKRRTGEPFIFLVFGLCLTVAFGLRCWNSQLGLAGLDRQIADLRAHAEQGFLPLPGNPSMIVADTMSELLTEQQDLQRRFQRDLTGLGIGLLTLIVGAVGWFHEQPESVDRWRSRRRSQRLASAGRCGVGVGPGDLVADVATTVVRAALLLFVIISGLKVIHGTPPSPQLVDQALTRLTGVVITIANSLS